MMRKTVRGIGIYYCGECLGFAFRMGDLERLSTVKFVSSVWLASSEAPLNDKIECPDCRQSTREIYDECRNFVDQEITLRQRARLNMTRVSPRLDEV